MGIFEANSMKTVITSDDRSSLSLSELRRYYGLFKYLSLRDVFIRYKQTWMGFGWSIVRPLVNILIFGSLRYLLQRTESFADSFLTAAAGIIFWQLLSTAITEVSSSLTANANILTKVYFPKILLPLSAILVSLVDFLIGLVLFLIIYSLTTGVPPIEILYLPLVVLYGLVFCFAIGLLAATASVKYRDVKFILPFLLQILFYASPVFISSDFVLGLNIPEWLKVMYQINPLLFLLNAFKFCFFGHFESFNMLYAGISVVISILLLFLSVRYFFSFEKSFADHI
jgi:lipopolysaccharide transport system permease protein